MDAENINLHEELKRLEEQIESAAELAALKPIYFRLNEIIQAFPGDFEVQFTGNDIKQRLMARGTLLKQQETSPPPPLPSQEMPAAEPPPLPMFPPDAVMPAPVARPEPPVMPAATPSPTSFPFSDSTPPEPPRPAFAVTPENPPLPPARPMPPPTPTRPTPIWKRAVVIAPIAGLLVALVLIVLVVQQRRKSNTNIAAPRPAAVQVDVATVPPGAFVKVAAAKFAAGGGNEITCTSNCKLALAPGTYQVSASLDGFEPVDSAVTVTAGQPAVVSLTLPPQAQSVRLLTDLDKGKVVVDGGSPVDLQEGQLVLDKVAPGTHTVKVIGQNGEASFSFEIAAARLPGASSQP